eukprot:4525328-Prymnesium_polylepis.1
MRLRVSLQQAATPPDNEVLSRARYARRPLRLRLRAPPPCATRVQRLESEYVYCITTGAPK